jgi:hypothetical protein
MGRARSKGGGSRIASIHTTSFYVLYQRMFLWSSYVGGQGIDVEIQPVGQNWRSDPPVEQDSGAWAGPIGDADSRGDWPPGGRVQDAQPPETQRSLSRWL